MVLYVFRCESGCGTIKQLYSMSSRPDVIECPGCNSAARRLISAPNIGRGGVGMALQDATRATADRPAVVSSPTPGARRRQQKITTNPLHQKLPRPS